MRTRGYGQALREAVVDEAIAALPVVMTLEQFQELVAATPTDLALWERRGRLQSVSVADQRYVFPGLVRELLCELGMLWLPLSPLSPLRASELMYGSRVVRPALSEDALEVLVFEALLAGVSVDEHAAEVLERYAFDGSTGDQMARARRGWLTRRWSFRRR